MTKQEIKNKIDFLMKNEHIGYFDINDITFIKNSDFRIIYDYNDTTILFTNRSGYIICQIAFVDVRSIE